MTYNLLHRPSLLKPSCDGVVNYSKSSRPFSQSVRFSVVCQLACFTCVLALLKRSCPFAVCWPAVCDALFAVATRIITFIVDPLNTVCLGWLLTHVGEEVCKRLSPMCTHANTPKTIPVVPCVIWVVASCLYLSPGTMFWCLVSATSTCAMTSAGFGRFLAKFTSGNNGYVAAFTLAFPERITTFCFSNKLKYSKFVVDTASFIRPGFAASARLDVAGTERAPAEDLFGTALAFAVPVSSSLTAKIATCVANHSQLSVLLAGNVFCSASRDCRIVRRHDSTPFQLDCDLEPRQSTTTDSARFILARS